MRVESRAKQPLDAKALVASRATTNTKAVVSIVDKDALKEEDRKVYSPGKER